MQKMHNSALPRLCQLTIKVHDHKQMPRLSVHNEVKVLLDVFLLIWYLFMFRKMHVFIFINRFKGMIYGISYSVKCSSRPGAAAHIVWILNAALHNVSEYLMQFHQPRMNFLRNLLTQIHVRMVQCITIGANIRQASLQHILYLLFFSLT